MKSYLMLNCLKFHHIIHDTTAPMHQQVPCRPTRKKMISWACCKLAPALARQIWRHNYVIGRNEYVISTLSESTFPWVYSLQFSFKSTHRSWRYERKCDWMFVFWTQCTRNYKGERLKAEWQPTIRGTRRENSHEWHVAVLSLPSLHRVLAMSSSPVNTIAHSLPFNIGPTRSTLGHYMMHSSALTCGRDNSGDVPAARWNATVLTASEDVPVWVRLLCIATYLFMCTLETNLIYVSAHILKWTHNKILLIESSLIGDPVQGLSHWATLKSSFISSDTTTISFCIVYIFQREPTGWHCMA